jgi:HNH endonuclease
LWWLWVAGLVWPGARLGLGQDGLRCPICRDNCNPMARTSATRNGSTRRWRETRARMLRQLPAICGICGRLIADPQPCDVDHILPVEHGTTDQPSNLTLTHRSCNRGRRVKVAPRAAPATTPTDENPGHLIRTWSATGSAATTKRCGVCRRRGHACPDADPDLPSL